MTKIVLFVFAITFENMSMNKCGHILYFQATNAEVPTTESKKRNGCLSQFFEYYKS